MNVVHSPEEMQRRAIDWRKAGRRAALVPTMGCLHEGHLSLMRLARAQCDVLVTSQFVNPMQFAPHENFKHYPRDAKRDERLCAETAVDILFSPDAETMFAPDVSVWVSENALSASLCGASRPGHFRGVCTVVAKLFNLVLPEVAMFGEKDAQQLRIIERMVRDLNMPVKILRGPTVREADGLAMSSRNTLLKPKERREAIVLHGALSVAEARVADGERSTDRIVAAVQAHISTSALARMDYVQLVDDETLEPVKQLERNSLLALAVVFGSTRLIDSRMLKPYTD